MSYENVIRIAAGMPWAIMPEKLAEIETMLRVRLAGVPITADERAKYAATQAPRMQGGGGVAVLPVYGVMSQRMNMMAESSGGTSTEQLAAELRQLVLDPQVGAIVLDVDSPGGSVYGLDELASEIRSARSRKPIVAVANSLMASAAYYISSAANEVIVTPGGEVGSIGVRAMHVDQSAAEEMAGLKVTQVTAGKYKGEGSEHFPLTEEALAHLEADVARYYEMFLSAVAAGRGVTVEAVRNGFGEGRVVGAREAVRLGMADKVGTLQDTIARLQTPAGRGAIMRRAEDARLLTADNVWGDWEDRDEQTGAFRAEIVPPEFIQAVEERMHEQELMAVRPDDGGADARLRRARI